MFLPKAHSSFGRILLFLFFRLCDVSIIVVFSPENRMLLLLSYYFQRNSRIPAAVAELSTCRTSQHRREKNEGFSPVGVAGGFESVYGYGFFICVVMSLRPIPFFVGKQCGWLLRKLWCFGTSKSNPHDQSIARRKHEDTIHMESSQCSVLSFFLSAIFVQRYESHHINCFNVIANLLPFPGDFLSLFFGHQHFH